MTSSYTTFRVRGIPARSSKDNVEALVKRALTAKDSLEFRIRSLASDRPGSGGMVATVNFASVPTQLATCVSGAEWSTELSDDISLLFDTHFHGCTTLFCPSEDSWTFDIFAISGLNGHAFGSFKKKNESYMWLRDALWRDFPGSRIVIYGYDSTLRGSKSFQNILDIAQKFRTALAEARSGKKKKPLVLVGHSLGGLVVKEVVNVMRTSHFDEDTLNFAAIRGFVFFGVPNQGMDIHSLIPMVGDQPNRGLLQNLEHNSPILRNQAQYFSAALTDLRCEVLNFYETQESPTAQQDESGKWSMTGPLTVLVNTFSATHGRPDNAVNHRVCPIDRSHSDLVKFSSAHDEAYKTLVAYLNGIDYSETENYHVSDPCGVGDLALSGLPSHMTAERTRARPAALAHLFPVSSSARRQSDGGDEMDLSGTGPQTAISQNQEDCLQSLGFREQYQRMDSLQPAEGTCDWLTKHEYFVEWLANPKGLLWIRGMPGSGKSMAMKHMLEHVGRLPTMNAVVASFFFHAQGVDLQRSVLGLYRALLHQLYPHFLHQLSELTARCEEYKKNFGQGKQDIDWSWMSGEIRTYFLEGISKACKQKSIVLFIDAVDEAGRSPAKEVFRDLQNLVASLTDDSCQLKICLSCRHYPEIILESGKALAIEEFNHGDIERVVSSRIDSLHIFGDSEKQQIKADVLGKAGGSFQWTSLVINSIVHERTQGNSFQAALETMKSVPTDLDFLYKALLEAGEHECSLREQKQRRALFHWLLFAPRPLSPKELQHALALNQDTNHSSIHDYESSPGFILAEDYETRIRTLSKGLVHLRGPFESGQVEFIHQSVVDFFNNCEGLRLLFGSSNTQPIRLAHFEISRSCLRYLFMAEIYDVLCTQSTNLLQEKFPLISYAWKHWIFHAVSAKSQDGEAMQHNDDDILEMFRWPNDQAVTDLWVPLRSTLECPLKSWREAFHRETPSVFGGGRFRYQQWDYLGNGGHENVAEWPIDGSRLVHLFALCGLLDGSVETRMMLSSEVNTLKSSSGRVPTPLTYAIVGQQKQIFRRLIKAGARFQYDGLSYHHSPIHIASIWGDVEALSLLIASGANSASSDPSGWTPLHLAAAFGHEGASNVLLSAKANVNSKTLQNVTPLYLATCYGHYEISKRLLDLGANPNVKTSLGHTALSVAIFQGEWITIELLLLHGARANEQLLTEAICKGSLKTVRLLLEHGTNVNARGRRLETAFVTAMKIGNQDIAELLINFGADLNAKNIDIRVPLHFAAQYNDIRFAVLLLAHGADPNIKDKFGATPLIIAMELANEEVGQLLLKHGADPNLKDDRGRTALMKAALAWRPPADLFWVGENHGKIVEMLLGFGADPSARSLDGFTAYSSPKNEEIDKLLRDAGCPLDFKGEKNVPGQFLYFCRSWGRKKQQEFRQKILRR